MPRRAHETIDLFSDVIVDIRETCQVSIRLTRPTNDELRSMVEASRDAATSYSPVGLTAANDAPPGYRLDRWDRALGSGEDVFDGASRALREWAVHRGAGLMVCAAGPPTVGLVVAMSAPLPLGFIDVMCRVVSVVDEPNRFGFAYGTLPIHPEQGEESFIVERDDDGEVAFRIIAVSRPRHALARLCPPVARRLQRAATERYLDAMTESVR